MDGFQFIDIIFLGALAVFIAIKLRNVLGKDMGQDISSLRDMAKQEQQRVIPLPERESDREALALHEEREQEEKEALAEISNGEVSENLVKIKQADPTFSVSSFLEGARTAFEWVVEGFNKGDSKTLKDLLAKEVYETFSKEMDEQKKSGKRTETTLVSIEKTEIVDASITGKLIEITVRFITEQIQVVRDKSGEIVEGNVSRIEEIADEWTFERTLGSRNPNWKIAAT